MWKNCCDKHMPGKGKTPITREQLATYSKELRGVAAKISEITRQLDESGKKTIDVMGQKTANTGLAYFDSLIQSCERELRNINLGRKSR